MSTQTVKEVVQEKYGQAALARPVGRGQFLLRRGIGAGSVM